MAEKTTKTKKNKNLYKAMPGYKKFMGGPGALTDEQHEALLSNQSVDLSGVPEKQMNYLITNNLIEGDK